MKGIIFLAAAFLSFTTVKAQHDDHNHSHTTTTAATVSAADPLELKSAEYNFGSIPQNKPVYHYFEIVNTGLTPLKLDNVTATCGCTTPEWSKDAIPAGGSQKIKVGYNAAADGVFEKYITITYNGNMTKQVKIKGTVWKAPSGSAPANESVQFLKQQIN